MKLTWSKSPSRTDTTLGVRKRWLTEDRSYEIDQYPQSTGRYVAVRRPLGLLGDFRTLKAAQRACLTDAKQSKQRQPRRGATCQTHDC